MKKLIIVESVTKAKKIQSLLGQDYLVKASIGHICDLPKTSLGVDLETLEPQWEVTEDKERTIIGLKKAAKASTSIFLASDPDREGEAIAWHLKRILKLKDVKRITFNEITEAAIHKALQSPRNIDLQAVNAQIARRVLDRLVGYQVSPLLSRAAQTKLSAGRVQSVALKLCASREREIREFKSQAYFELDAVVNGLIFQLQHQNICPDKHITQKAILENIQNQVEKLVVKDSVVEHVSIPPRPPFITSTLQQAASVTLGLPPEETMKTAQKLFEEGLITYHRTDNPNFSSEGFLCLKGLLELRHPGLSRGEAIKRQSAALAQEAHEAIRPTGVTNDSLTQSQQELLALSEARNLYRLICERSLAAVAQDGQDEQSKISLISEPVSLSGIDNPVELQWSWKGRVVKSLGWRELLQLEPVDNEEATSNNFPGMGSSVKPEWKLMEKKTKATERFTEAALIKALEKLGIGRPSTYATILSNIKSRAYIKLSARKIHVLPIGMELVESLDSMSFMKYDFTRKVENHLDLVAQGADHKVLLKTMNELLNREMQQLKPIFTEENRKTEKCPLCGEIITQRKAKKNGKPYWVHLLDNLQCLSFINDKSGKPSVSKRQ